MKTVGWMMVVILMVSSLLSAQPQSCVATHGSLSVQGTQLADSHGDPIDDVSNVMYTLHFYAATHKQSLRDRGDYALAKGLPIFVSEYGGCEASGNGPLNMEEWDAWIQWMEGHKISWCKWSIADKNKTCSVLVPGANSTGGWQTEDLKESGIHSRELLRELNGTVRINQ